MPTDGYGYVEEGSLPVEIYYKVYHCNICGFKTRDHKEFLNHMDIHQLDRACFNIFGGCSNCQYKADRHDRLHGTKSKGCLDSCLDRKQLEHKFLETLNKPFIGEI